MTFDPMDTDLGDGQKITRFRTTVEMGIDGDAQESEFMNATLQAADDFEFSIATRLTFPALSDDQFKFSEENQIMLADRIAMVLAHAAAATRKEWDDRVVLEFEVQVGPSGEYWANLEDLDDSDLDTGD
jgi:hypothetical protein